MLTIFTDGASRGNPGHSSYGFVVLNDKNEILYEGKKYLGIETNNFAEYSAVLESLLYVSKNLRDTDIRFFMDSLLVVMQLSGKYKIKSPNLLPLIEQIKKLEKLFSKITYSHVPREKNKMADKLANIALDNHLSKTT